MSHIVHPYHGLNPVGFTASTALFAASKSKSLGSSTSPFSFMSSYPHIPPQSSSGQAPLPAVHLGNVQHTTAWPVNETIQIMRLQI